jgi:hypothetical protein
VVFVAEVEEIPVSFSKATEDEICSQCIIAKSSTIYKKTGH